MQELPPSRRRVGCVMWLAIFAIVMSLASLLSSITQELAWDRRVSEITTAVSAMSANPENTPVLAATQVRQEQPAVVIVGPTTDPSISPQPTVITPPVTPTSTPLAGLTYDEVCKVDESNMTDPQLEAHASRFNGRTFNGWQGWVYDVVSKSDNTYDLQIAMEKRSPFWGRDIVVEDIPLDLATRLNVEQVLVFDGRIAQVEYAFDVMCNPMKIDNFTLR